MSTTIVTVPPIGQRVTVNDGIGLPRGWSGATATIVGEYAPGQPYVMFDRDIDRFTGPRPEGLEGSWVITGWDMILPEIGDKVIPLPESNVNWYGIPVQYRNAVGTVTEIASEDDATGRRWIAAEFPSYQKPDDTIRWSFYYCKPAVTLADVMDTAYRPTVGDKVTISGYLSNEGIIDTVAHDGYIRAVDGDIWTIESPLYGRQVSGPGYITLVRSAAEAEEAEAPRPTDTETNLMEEVDTLKHELERANERVNEYGVRAGKWERDFATYANRIMQEAIDRDWCSEYERIMDEIEGDLEIAEIPKRRKRVQRTVKMRGEVWVETTVWIDEDCNDEDDPDNWYESQDADDDEALGSDWCEERLSREYENNGFDDTEYEAR